jgi:hypothetical protein
MLEHVQLGPFLSSPSVSKTNYNATCDLLRKGSMSYGGTERTSSLTNTNLTTICQSSHLKSIESLHHEVLFLVIDATPMKDL